MAECGSLVAIPSGNIFDDRRCRVNKLQTLSIVPKAFGLTDFQHLIHMKEFGLLVLFLTNHIS